MVYLEVGTHIFTGLFSTLVTINHRRFMILAIGYNDYTCTL